MYDFIKSLDSKKSSVADRIPVRFMKACPLAHITKFVNLQLASVKHSAVPKAWKVTSIHKSKWSSDLANQWPISVLPALSKLQEQIMFNNLYKHLDRNHLLTDHQSSFRPGHSTEGFFKYAQIWLMDETNWRRKMRRCHILGPGQGLWLCKP